MRLLVPDYYPDFRCKAAECRNACCEGWPVTFSMADYFRLLGIKASPETKGRLDRALHFTDHPTEDEYAMILPRYDGKCPMHMDNGLCAIHAEAGEEALPAVCRLYPRGLRDGEISCANSCEAVIELLYRTNPLVFRSMEIPISFKAPPRLHFFETGGRETEIRLWLIGIVQDRRMALASRLNRLGQAVCHMDDALTAHDSKRVEELLAGADFPAAMPDPDKEKALRIIRALLCRLDERSDSIRAYGQLALERFEQDDDPERTQARFLSTCPLWETWFENMIVNHMFFAQFPFQDRPVSLREEVAALFSVYGLLRFMMAGAGDGTLDRLIDIAAALFRLVDHTAFDQYAAAVLKEICGPDDIALLLAV